MIRNNTCAADDGACRTRDIENQRARFGDDSYEEDAAFQRREAVPLSQNLAEVSEKSVSLLRDTCLFACLSSHVTLYSLMLDAHIIGLLSWKNHPPD